MFDEIPKLKYGKIGADWDRLQHKWYNVIINNKSYPLMVNKYGNFVDKYSKEEVFVRNNYMAKKYGKLDKSWKETIKSGFDECMRVLKPYGTLIFNSN